MDIPYITATDVALDWPEMLARPEAKRLSIIGAGTVAEGLIAAYPTLFSDLEIEIWNRNMARSRGAGGYYFNGNHGENAGA